MEKTENLKVGIIGAGTIFRDHANAYRKIGIPIAAVADSDLTRAKAAANQYEIPLAVSDWRELLAKPEIRIIDICSPPKFHFEAVAAALRAGKNVICEKPLALSLQQADEILKLESAVSAKLAVMHQYRFEPVYQRMKWLVENGHLGRMVFARCVRYDAPPKHLLKEGVWGRWDLAGGGMLMTKAIHQIDLFLWLFGKVKRVNAMMKTSMLPIESEDQMIANLEFNNGMLVSLCLSAQPHLGYVEAFDCVGERGAVARPWNLKLTDKETECSLIKQLEIQIPSPKTYAGFAASIHKIFDKLRGISSSHESPHTIFLRHFIQSLTCSDAVLPVSAKEGRDAMEVCTAIYTSALTGLAVDLPLSVSSPFYNGITKKDYKQ